MTLLDDDDDDDDDILTTVFVPKYHGISSKAFTQWS